MKRLISIYSQRKTSNWPSFKIVYEWEDILSSHLGLPIVSDGSIVKSIYRRIEKYGLFNIYNLFLPKSNYRLDFVMKADTKTLCRNNSCTIPVIIDFWLKDEEIPLFIDAYKYVPLMLLTNLEVYEKLKASNCPFPIEHWPLSYPDQYAFADTVVEGKIYDFCLFGRPNPFFERLRDEYAEKHPDFIYLITKGDEKNREFYTNKGEFICKDSGRASYLNMIKKTKITCYSTPGVDEAKNETASYNQVTPRLFEMLCNGCHVIGHYPNTADTTWYELTKIIPNVTNYQEFETVLDHSLCSPINVEQIKQFMSQHYTSQRVLSLKEIMKKYDIKVD